MILNNVKRLLQINILDNSKDELISTIIELTLAKVRALCNIPKDIQKELMEDYDFSLLIAQIAADIYLSYDALEVKQDNEEGNSTDIPVGQGSVKSVTIGDYKVEYNSTETTSTYKTSSLADALSYYLDRYDEELVNYRYVRFF